jgi:hypothetical protein
MTMATDPILAASPLTVTRQIVEQTSQAVAQVRDNAEKALLEEGDPNEQSVSRPETQPVGTAQESSQDGGLGQKSAEADKDGAEGGGKNPSRGTAVNTSA